MKKEDRMKNLIKFVCIIACTPLLVSNVSAASAKCTIVKIEGEKMTVSCPKGLERFKEGWMIKIKSSDQKKIEGC